MREIIFNAWIPELNYMMEDVSLGHGSIGFPTDDEDFKKALINKGFNPDELEVPDWLYDNGEDWYYITDPKQFILLQFTGMKDINDTPIFEGHILKYAHDWDYTDNIIKPENRIFKKVKKNAHGYLGYYIGVVEWEGEHAHYVTNPKRMNLSGSILNLIIGNVYQNPDLLK